MPSTQSSHQQGIPNLVQRYRTTGGKAGPHSSIPLSTILTTARFPGATESLDVCCYLRVHYINVSEKSTLAHKHTYGERAALLPHRRALAKVIHHSSRSRCIQSQTHRRPLQPSGRSRRSGSQAPAIEGYHLEIKWRE